MQSTEELSEGLEYCRFAINNTPYAVWGNDVQADNLRCIESIDPAYFRYLARIHKAELETEEKQFAAVALRAAYSHALETMFALLGAAIQAPWCVPGWLRLYQNKELEQLIGKIHRQEPIYTWLREKPVSWQNIASTILPINVGEDRRSQVQKAFAQFWHKAAQEFLDADTSEEYNSIKHGLRAGMSGFTWAMGIQSEPGIPAETLKTLSSSEFGLHYFSTELIGPTKSNPNRKLVHKSYNWHPEKFQIALDLIACSIQNTLSYLRWSNGIPETELEFAVPEDLAIFKQPWDPQSGINRMTWSNYIEPAMIDPCTADDILAVYSESRDEVTLGMAGERTQTLRRRG